MSQLWDGSHFVLCVRSLRGHNGFKKKRCWTRIGAKPPCRVRRAKPEQDWGNPRRVRKRAEPNQKKRRGKASSQSAPRRGGTQASRDNTANDESHSSNGRTSGRISFGTASSSALSCGSLTKTVQKRRQLRRFCISKAFCPAASSKDRRLAYTVKPTYWLPAAPRKTEINLRRALANEGVQTQAKRGASQRLLSRTS